MLRPDDIKWIESRGSSISTIEEQIKNFQSGFPYLTINSAATIGNGIVKLNNEEIKHYKVEYDKRIRDGLRILKFVPASGAASRMFKSLYEASELYLNGKDGFSANDEIKTFIKELSRFAFYEDLKKRLSNDKININDARPIDILDFLLTDKGLNYGNMPKGLLKFHQYSESSRSPLEEHCIEGALYGKDINNEVNIHFTVSPEHQPAFEEQVAEIKKKYEKKLNVIFQISFSRQKLSTDTIAVTENNEPFREEDGSLLFRPGGHGALIENLNDLNADIIFIKNIDNIVPDRLKDATILYKKVLAGVLLKTQERVFHYQKILNERHYYSLESGFFAEASNFLENVLNTKPPINQYYTEKEELYHYLRSKFNRPLRVCGMVRNEGEPGGGPFWARNRDGSISLQVVESSQIDLNDKEQLSISKEATHFNPVDLVCSVKNYLGEKFNLPDFVDPQTGFISNKSKDGKTLKALELPGLWNGAMSDWNTIFVEVPIETFNPVKTVIDLLRKEHQPS